MTTRTRRLFLAIFLASLWLPQTRADDTATTQPKRPSPGWKVMHGRDGEIRRLAANSLWKPKALEDLKGLDSLEYLDLSGTKLADDDMPAFAALTSLKTLLLARTGVSDQGMAHLAGLDELETLDLAETQVSDAGLQHLRRLGKLRCLVTHRSRVTDEGLQDLERARPGFEAVRLWDVTAEEFDHALLLRTPRFDLIQDGVYFVPDFKATDQLQVSGPARKASLADARKKASPKPSMPQRSLPQPQWGKPFPIVCNIKTGDRFVSTVKVEQTTLPVTNRAQTYVVDGQGKVTKAGFSLQFDLRCGLWLEMPSKSSDSPGAARKEADTPASGYTPTTNIAVGGVWNGKYVWGLIDVEAFSHLQHFGSLHMSNWNGVTGKWHYSGVIDEEPVIKASDEVVPIDPTARVRPLRERERRLPKYRSNAGFVVVFLHTPGSSFGTQLHPVSAALVDPNTISGPFVPLGGQPQGLGLPPVQHPGVPYGIGSTPSQLSFDSSPSSLSRPAAKDETLVARTTWVSSSASLGLPNGQYCAKEDSRETERLGSAWFCDGGFFPGGSSSALGRCLYLKPSQYSNHTLPRWQEIADPRWRESDMRGVRLAQLRIEKRGKELVSPVSGDRETTRLELVDFLGRKHVLEEQRIDLTGPKKTIVLDSYGRLRVLTPADAERILRTRLRDYLDDGDPSPAGPVAPVASGKPDAEDQADAAKAATGK